MDKGRSLSTPVRKAAHSQAVAVYGKAYFEIGVRHDAGMRGGDPELTPQEAPPDEQAESGSAVSVGKKPPEYRFFAVGQNRF